MKKIAILLIILFASCEAPSSGVSETDTNTFEKNVQTLKDGFIAGYEEMDFDKVISIFADSIKYYPSGVDSKIEKILKDLNFLKDTSLSNFETSIQSMRPVLKERYDLSYETKN